VAGDPSKISLQTADLAAMNRAAFEQMFPGALADGVLDSGRLGELLDTDVAPVKDGRERYGLMWAGKHEAVRTLLAPSEGTLKPNISKSVAFESAENVFIEGDNLEVLKLLQKAYNDRVKLIYIDPPYNTGNDFVYSDDFSDGLSAYLRYTGQLTEDGNRQSASADLVGRRHSRWLSMMYVRLVLARNLLTQDGVIYVSIDDNEQANLRLLMDEIFGPENFLGCVTVVSNLKGRSDDKYFATAHNYLLVYQRSTFIPLGVPLPEEYKKDYPERDGDDNPFRLQGLRKRGNSARREDRPSMYYPLFVNSSSGSVSLSEDPEHTEPVLPMLSDGTEGRWRWGKETAQSRLSELIGRPVGPLNRWDVFEIDLLSRDGVERRVVPKTVWEGKEFANESGTLEVKKLMGERVFDTPKPTGLIRRILEHSVGTDDLIMDFFAGSGSTAHAVALMNAEDGGRRRCISVNLPEPVPADSVAARAGYSTVSDITLGRILAVMNQLEGAQAQGLKTFVLEASNFKLAASSVGDQLELREKTLHDQDPDFDAIAAQVLLSEGVALDAAWARYRVGEASVVIADRVAVVQSLSVDNAIVRQTFALGPRVAVFLEDGFVGADAVKANAFTGAKNAGITMKTV
jgi:adenine-specific DNA-methyltransferase